MTNLDTPSDEFAALSGYSSELASMFVLLAGDIALVVGQDGVIQNVALSAKLADPSANTWIGSHWADTVTGETKRKIELLLQEVHGSNVTRRREVNHCSSDGTGIPVSYTALRLGNQGPVIAVGRDLRTVSAIQQQMVRSQQEMERSYWSLRRNQDHLRELEQVASDAVLVVTGPDFRISRFNEAAGSMLMQPDGTICAQLKALSTQAMQSGRAVEVRARLKSKGLESPLLDMFVAPFHGRDPGTAPKGLLVRARQVGRSQNLSAETPAVITDTQGHILMASDALIAMCGDSDSDNLFGKFLTDVLDNAQGVFSGLLREALREGMAHTPSAIIGGRPAAAYEAEVRATLMIEGEKERVGFSMRIHTSDDADEWLRSLESLVISRRPLSELLQEVRDLTERRVISNALRTTSANLSVSANQLGVSVEDLMQRVKRLGLDHAQYTAH